MVQFCRSPQIQEPGGALDPILMDWILHLVYFAVVVYAVYKGSPRKKKKTGWIPIAVFGASLTFQNKLGSVFLTTIIPGALSVFLTAR